MSDNLGFFILGSFVFVLLIICLSVYFKLGFRDSTPIILATAAILVSTLSLFRANLFPAKLEIIAGNNIILNSDKPSNLNPGIILPITFVNKGYDNCIIEIIALKLFTEDNLEIFYEPISEIDIKALMQGKHKVHGSNIIDGYSSFNLFERSSKIISFLFMQIKPKMNSQEKLHPLKIGKYTCTLYVKKIDDEKLLPVTTFKLTVDDMIINNLNKGTTTFKLNYEYKF